MNCEWLKCGDVVRALRARCVVVLAMIGVGVAPATAQPIPVELTVTEDYATTNLVVSRMFTPTSRLGFFHLSTIEMVYEDESQNGMAIQNLMFVQLPREFRVTGGAFVSERGFSPTAGMQYIKAGRDLFVLLAPRVNIESDPSYSVFSIVRYRPQITPTTRLYLGAQLLNTFSAERHLRSYQWLRFGLEVKGTQFGLAVNLDQEGPARHFSHGLGAFVRREIF